LNTPRLLTKKLQRDREAAMSYTPPAPVTRETRPVRETHTYTAEELAEARKTGRPLPGARQPSMPPSAVNPGNDAVQRSLRTLDEINRINEMNRRLQEQQQRTQQQK
jgi:hypothetical protein